ncbi:MAG: metalloregulator ArsR/SmtB family transcription factor [Actinomycetaceae bacterium]|nr:metalloregulator ArsR/SmtB family transcription factor [Actinomycetaceae bacterium]
MAIKRPTAPGSVAGCAQLFQALADPTRLAIVEHLATGEHRVRDLVEHMGFAQSTVSKHLSVLLDCGIVSVRPQGRSSWYSLTDAALLDCLMAAAETLLQATGAHSMPRVPRPSAIAATEVG